MSTASNENAGKKRRNILVLLPLLAFSRWPRCFCTGSAAAILRACPRH